MFVCLLLYCKAESAQHHPTLTTTTTTTALLSVMMTVAWLGEEKKLPQRA